MIPFYVNGTFGYLWKKILFFVFTFNGTRLYHNSQKHIVAAFTVGHRLFAFNDVTKGFLVFPLFLF